MTIPKVFLRYIEPHNPSGRTLQVSDAPVHHPHDTSGGLWFSLHSFYVKVQGRLTSEEPNTSLTEGMKDDWTDDTDLFTGPTMSRCTDFGSHL